MQLDYNKGLLDLVLSESLGFAERKGLLSFRVVELGFVDGLEREVGAYAKVLLH